MDDSPASATDLVAIAEQLAKAYEAVSECMIKHFNGFGVDKAWGPMGAGSLLVCRRLQLWHLSEWNTPKKSGSSECRHLRKEITERMA